MLKEQMLGIFQEQNIFLHIQRCISKTLCLILMVVEDILHEKCTFEKVH